MASRDFLAFFPRSGCALFLTPFLAGRCEKRRSEGKMNGFKRCRDLFFPFSLSVHSESLFGHRL
jgi:hypothetical protein